MAEITDRAATIRNYLHAGKSVCPFAKACPLEVTTVAKPRGSRAAILRSTTAFAAARGNALILLSKTDKGFAPTAAWATEAFLELVVCCAQISQPEMPIAEIEDYVERVVRPILDSHEIRPYLTLHNKALMTICMAPVYPTAHPRYAPHTILVATWSDDVGAAGSVPKIREAMAKEHGTVYDANELMLPLPTKTKLKMWTGNFDGLRQGLVIATSKERARKIVGSGLTDFNDYWSEHPVDSALEPEVLYTRSLKIPRHGEEREPWQRGRCPLSTKEKP